MLLRDDSTFLNLFNSHEDAFQALDELITQQDWDNRGDHEYYYGIVTNDTGLNADPAGGIYKVTAFSASHLVYDDSDLHWQEQLWNRPRFTAWLHNNIATVVTEFKLSGYQVLPLPAPPDPDVIDSVSTDAGKSPVVQDRRHHRMGDLQRRRDPHSDLRIHDPAARHQLPADRRHRMCRSPATWS